MREDDQRQPTVRDIDYGAPLRKGAVERGGHRKRVGGLWERMGHRQLRFLQHRGLRPEHKVLDVGCGALRAGVQLVDYLDPGNYYGVDINGMLLEAGYEEELTDDLRAKLPRDSLRATDRFDVDFGVRFDYAIAQSVFTHISLNQIRLCLYRVANVMPPGGRFFASFFEAPGSHPLDRSQNDGRRWTERNVFFYYQGDLEWAAGCAPWEFRYIGRWHHPRGQRIVEFRRQPTPKRFLPLRRIARRALRR